MNKYEELERFSNLKEKWILTEDEFQFEKNRILNKKIDKNSKTNIDIDSIKIISTLDVDINENRVIPKQTNNSSKNKDIPTDSIEDNRTKFEIIEANVVWIFIIIIVIAFVFKDVFY